MRPGDYPLDLYRGDSYSWQFKIWTDQALPPTAADLTGVTAKAEVRDTPGGLLLATLTCTITLPNTILVKLPAALWTGLNRKQAAWDLQLTYADLSVVTIIAGAVTVTPDVTDSVPITMARARPMGGQNA